MENATKALLMAAGVLIGIVILSLGVYLYGTIGNYVQMSQEEMNNQALIKFNTQFYNYTAIENQQYTFQDIITIANIAYENNSEKELLDETVEFTIRMLIELKKRKNMLYAFFVARK